MAVSLSSVGNLLAQLLRLHNRVSLPGMGAFVAEYQPASFIRGGKGMLPPAKTITFSTTELWNDGFLEEALANKTRIAPEEAKQELAQFIQEVHTLLKEGKRVELPNFGTMRITADGTYLFEKEEDTNLLPDSFGLLELDVTPLSYDDIPEPVANPHSGTTPLQSAITPLTPLTPIAATGKAANKEQPAGKPKRKRKCNKVCWIILAIVLLIIAVFLGRSMYVFYSSQEVVEEITVSAKQETAPVTTVPVQIVEEDIVVVKEEPKPMPPQSVAQEIAPKKAAPKPEQKTELSTPKSKPMNMFHIMLGSFADEASAKAAMDKQMSGNGCSCMVLNTGGTKPFKVSAYRYWTNKEATELLDVFKTTDSEYKNSWVEKY